MTEPTAMAEPFEDSNSIRILTTMRDMEDRMNTTMRDMEDRINARFDKVDDRFDKQDQEIYSSGKEITALSTHMRVLVGNGQPGKIQLIESAQVACKTDCQRRIGDLENKRSEWLGKHTVISAIAASVVSFLMISHDHWLAWFRK